MKRRYRLPLKTRLMLLLISPFRRRSPLPPTLAQLRRARKEVPRFFLSNWVLGRPAPCDMAEHRVPMRDGHLVAVRTYRPRTDEALPLVLNYHGGGWAVGNLQNNDYYCAAVATQARCVVVSVDYRLAPEHKFPMAVHDAYDALCWAAQHAATLGADPARICVTGDSAGGNLAAVVSLLVREQGGPPIAYQALIYPATDSSLRYPSLETHAHAPILTKTDVLNYLDMYVATEEDRASVLLSPYRATDLSGLPPALVVTAGYDPLCDDGHNYAHRLNAHGTAAEVLHFPEDLHGFFTFPNHSLSGKEAIAQVAARIRKVFWG